MCVTVYRLIKQVVDFDLNVEQLNAFPFLSSLKKT